MSFNAKNPFGANNIIMTTGRNKVPSVVKAKGVKLLLHSRAPLGVKVSLFECSRFGGKKNIVKTYKG